VRTEQQHATLQLSRRAFVLAAGTAGTATVLTEYVEEAGLALAL